jgi:hypothetical protein
VRTTVLSAATAVLVLLACSDDARMQVSVRSYPNGIPEVRASWPRWQGTHTVVLDSTHTSTGHFDTGTSGTFTITFALMSGGVATTTAGTVDIPLRKDWSWGVDFWLTDTDPAGMCFGCFGSEAFDVDPVLGLAPDVKLWAVWGGNSISNPVTY